MRLCLVNEKSPLFAEAANTIAQHIATEDQKLQQNELAEQKMNRPIGELGVGTIYMNGSFPAPESHSAFIAAAGTQGKMTHVERGRIPDS